MLYPDEPIAIVLPASTFSLQVVRANRFLEKRKQDPKRPIDERWDDSVKALVNYPEVVKQLSADLDWTSDLGEAVVADQGAVLEAVQAFRRKAQAAKNLKSADKQTIVHTRTGGALVRASLLGLSIACVPHLLFAAQAPSGTAQPTPIATASQPADATTALTLYDIVVALGRNETMQRQVAATLRDTADWKTLADRLEDPALAYDSKALEERGHTLSRPRYAELVDADTRIRERVRTVNEATAALGRLLQKIEEDLENLGQEAARWPERAKLARELEAPAEIQRGIEVVDPGLAAMREQLRARRDQLLVAYQRAVTLQARLDGVRATIAERRERISADLRTVEDTTPIWRPGAAAFPREEIVADIRLAGLELVDFLRDNSTRLGSWFVALLALMFFALRRSPITGPQHMGIALRSAAFVVAGAVMSSLIFLAVLAPRGPFLFYRFIGIAAPLLAGVVATKSFASPIPATAWTLVLAVFVGGFRLIAEMSPGFARALLAIEVLPFGAALFHDWRRGAFAKFLPRWPPVLLRRLVQGVLLTLAVIIIASVLGYASIARTLSALAVIAPGFALIFAALARALDLALAGMLAAPIAQTLRSVRERGDAILRALHALVVLFCWTIGILAFVLAHSALDDLVRAVNFVANAQVSAGSVTIMLSSILSAVLVVAVTWLLTKLVRFLLDHEILPRLNLRTGVPIAISTIVGYVLVVIGFVLALAALGIDLTKVTLLAGALGVGVGFGLQSVVNNFASGLILMLERPINVGDQIDVGGVLGEVKRIGVRSSTVRTFQGADVIVPNSDLASNQVTNWTLSDRARRYEIDVRVAYGSDPERVLRLLESAVADLPEVQRVPQPRALFTGFGDSSLDFRLFTWVHNIDIGVQAQNSMRMAVLRVFGEAGIAIPFPQRDLHIRYAPAGQERAGAGGAPH